MDQWKNLLANFISNLPFKKLSANQTFNLAADILMIILVVVALFSDLGNYQGTLKAVLIFSSIGFIVWCVKITRGSR